MQPVQLGSQSVGSPGWMRLRFDWRLHPQVFLDKTWFGPVGKHLSDRDEELRKKLASVRDDSGDLKSLQVRRGIVAALLLDSSQTFERQILRLSRL